MHSSVPNRAVVCRAVSLITFCLLLAAPLAYGQQVTSTFNGRILDQGGLVLPGVTVTATNVSTGVVRTSVWSQLQMLTRVPRASTVLAHPPTLDRASTTSVSIPALAR